MSPETPTSAPEAPLAVDHDGTELTHEAEAHALQVLALHRAVEVEFLAADDNLQETRTLLLEGPKPRAPVAVAPPEPEPAPPPEPEPTPEVSLPVDVGPPLVPAPEAEAADPTRYGLGPAITRRANALASAMAAVFVVFGGAALTTIGVWHVGRLERMNPTPMASLVAPVQLPESTAPASRPSEAPAPAPAETAGPPPTLAPAGPVEEAAPARAFPIVPPHDDFGATRYGRYRDASAAERVCLARAVYYEARGEGFLGQVAVAQVILNRVRSRKWPDTICGVVNQGASRGEKCQFSYVCFKNLSEPSGEAYDLAVTVAEQAMEGGAYLRELEHATHYHTKAVTPIWRHALMPLTTIGSHIFYQEPGGVVESRPPVLAARPVETTAEVATAELLSGPGAAPRARARVAAIVATVAAAAPATASPVAASLAPPGGGTGSSGLRVNGASLETATIPGGPVTTVAAAGPRVPQPERPASAPWPPAVTTADGEMLNQPLELTLGRAALEAQNLLAKRETLLAKRVKDRSRRRGR